MALQRRFPVAHRDVFPAGAFLKAGSVGPVVDFNADKRPDGSRPQQFDKETGYPLWQATVVDADEEAAKRETAVSVKFAAKVQPVPPENKSGMPFTPVEFTGLTAMPWVEPTENGRGRIAWSYRAEGMVEPGSSPAPESGRGEPTKSRAVA